jgi:RES domain-containing protein
LDRGLIVAVASAKPVTVEGVFERHVSLSHRKLTGSAGGGRWGPPGAYPVLYLGRPTDSVIVEAYRHLVESSENMRPDLVAPRRVIRCEVGVTNILDLRDPSTRDAVGLSFEELMSDIDAHDPCQRVGQAAHQLEMHGVISPAATGLGDTLALFERRLPAAEQPVIIGETVWDQLPADPRRLRLTDRSA